MLKQSQTSCTSDVALPIDDTSASGSGSGSDAGAAAIASYQVAGASAIVDLTGSNLDGGSGGPADLIDIGSDPPLRRLLRKRAALECKIHHVLITLHHLRPACVANLVLKGTSSETCYSLQGSPLCVNDQ